MNTGKKYKTRQKELILDCLREHSGEYLTIRQILFELRAQRQQVGLTTIYRNLEKLEEERLISKSSIDGMDGICYRYAPVGNEADVFYLKCEVCGALSSIPCVQLRSLYTHVTQSHHVCIDPVKTVFYGVCSRCLQAANRPEYVPGSAGS